MLDDLYVLRAMAIREKEISCGCQAVLAVERGISRGTFHIGEPTVVLVPCPTHVEDGGELSMRISDVWAQPKNIKRFKDVPAEEAFATLFEELVLA